jgi:acyl-CoA thioester hydrolase
MDEMHHVNNAVYLTYFEQARIVYFGEALKLGWKEISFILASSHVDYLRPLVFPDPAFVYLRASKLGNKSLEMRYFVTTLVDEKEEVSATGYSTLVMYDYPTKQTMPIPEILREKIRSYEPEKI